MSEQKYIQSHMYQLIIDPNNLSDVKFHCPLKILRSGPNMKQICNWNSTEAYRWDQNLKDLLVRRKTPTHTLPMRTTESFCTTCKTWFVIQTPLGCFMNGVFHIIEAFRYKILQPCNLIYVVFSKRFNIYKIIQTTILKKHLLGSLIFLGLIFLKNYPVA